MFTERVLYIIRNALNNIVDSYYGIITTNGMIPKVFRKYEFHILKYMNL